MANIIQSFAKLIQVLTAQKNNLGTYQTAVGATAGDITQVTNMLGNLTALDTWCDGVLAYKESAFAFKQQCYDGDPALPIPAFPVAPVAPTLTAPLSGGLTRTNDANRRFRAAPGYTPAAGEALMIAGPSTPPPDPDDVMPTIIADADKAGYGFSLIVKGREQADSWVGSGTGKTADFIFHPTGADIGKPVQIRIEVQLRKNNANYGKPSAEELITVNP